jgi:hypothetical protein
MGSRTAVDYNERIRQRGRTQALTDPVVANGTVDVGSMHSGWGRAVCYKRHRNSVRRSPSIVAIGDHTDNSQLCKRRTAFPLTALLQRCSEPCATQSRDATDNRQNATTADNTRDCGGSPLLTVMKTS